MKTTKMIAVLTAVVVVTFLSIVPDRQFSIYAENENGDSSDRQTLTATPGSTIEGVVLTMR